jgi:transcription initiation factor TFIID subunit 5
MDRPESGYLQGELDILMSLSAHFVVSIIHLRSFGLRLTPLKFELSRLQWPIYIYSYLAMVMSNDDKEATSYLQKHRGQFERAHADELRTLETVTLPQHVLENTLTKLYRNNKYRLPLNKTAYFNLITFLEQNEKNGGSVILFLLQTHCVVSETARGPIDQFSFEAIADRAHGAMIDDSADLQEGIPGAFTGVSNLDMLNNNTPLKLGPMQMEPELRDDVRAELAAEDVKNPPEAGQLSLIDTFDQNIKREESVDAINRIEIPLPPSRARDVVMEVQKIKEYRDRFKIEGRTGGIGPPVSVIMFTFHNTMDRYVTTVELFISQELMKTPVLHVSSSPTTITW